MNEFTAAHCLLESVGVGRVRLIGAGCDALAVELSRLGCDVASGAPQPEPNCFDTIVWRPDEGSEAPAGELARIAPRMLAIWRPAGSRCPAAAELAQQVSELGFRNASVDRSVLHWEQAGPSDASEWLFFEPVREALPVSRPDPIGQRATDAELARCAIAAEQVRPGDRVLVVGSGCGAGAALIAARSRCAQVLGIDADAALVSRATQQFGGPGVEFRCEADEALPGIDDRSVGLVVAVGAWCDTAEWPAWLAAFDRVLRPDGRIVCSAVGSCGLDGLESLVARHFLVELRYAQQAGHEVTRPPMRRMTRLAPSERGDSADWWVVVASASPVGCDRQGYVHPEFEASRRHGSAVTEFASNYDNPWLYRPLVQMGQRLQNDDLLTDLAIDTLGRSAPDSADAGAALCVLAHRLIGQRALSHLDDLLPLIDAYAALQSANPHVLRWQISLDHAAALACLMAGRGAAAESYFERTAARDALAFSPLLSTKTVASCFWLGVRALVGRRDADARRWFSAGVQAGARALGAPIEQSIGCVDHPNGFGFQELAEVADMASQCAQALNGLPWAQRSPGLFWRQIDTRRFGLASWLQHLERENAALRRQLQAGETIATCA